MKKKPAAKNAAAKKPVARKPSAKKAAQRPVAKKAVAKRAVAKKSAKKPMAKGAGPKLGAAASAMIDARIEELGDWRGELLGKLRAIVKAADPQIEETWKWRGVPVWEHDGIVCTGETYKDVVKMTFAKGAALPDPAGLFNSSLDGGTRRAIDFPQGGTFDEEALKTLIRDAVVLNQSK